jgi:hypothetical protein
VLFGWLVRHATVTLVLMALSFVAFGALSVNLVSYVSANANYLLSYGWEAFKEGGLQQLLELWLQIFVAISTYLVFKLCEHALIERIACHVADLRETGGAMSPEAQ